MSPLDQPENNECCGIKFMSYRALGLHLELSKKHWRGKLE